MNHAHSLIAAIRSDEIVPAYLWEKVAPDALRLYGKRLLLIAQSIEDAQKFDFSPMFPFDYALRETGWEWLKAGIFQAPFPLSYFEFGRRGQNNSLAAALIVDDEAGFMVFPFVNQGGKWFEFAAYIDLKKAPIEINKVQWKGFFTNQQFNDEAAAVHWITDIAASVVEAVALLNAEGVQLDDVEAPEALNKHRLKKGRVPLFGHRVVKINGYSPRDAKNAQRGDRTSPRLHWRRGHLRTLPTGLRVPVRPSLVGDKAKGMVTHEYEVGSDPIARVMREKRISFPEAVEHLGKIS